MVLQSKLETCTDKLARPIDLFDPGEAASQEMCYLDTYDYKNMFSISWGCNINNCLSWLTGSVGSECTGKCPERAWWDG